MQHFNINLSRRALLKAATFGAIATALPPLLTSTVAAQEPRTFSNAVFYRFRLGDFRAISITDGTLTVPAALFATNTSPEQLEQVLRDSFQSASLTAHCNILFVDTRRNKVLIDTGSGMLSGPTAGRLQANLRTLGIRPAEIDTIIITHAHSDHIGGVADATGKLVFPNARYYVSQIEADFWTDPKVSLPKVKLDEALKKQMIAAAQKHLGIIKARMTRFAVNQEIIPGFYAIPAPGHTPGQVAIRISTGNAVLVHTADVVHNQAINLWQPKWQPAFDADPVQAVQTRQQILEMVASERRLVFAYHFPFPGLGYVRPRNGEGYTWEPIVWQFNAA